jgi:hypothetical protein
MSLRLLRELPLKFQHNLPQTRSFPQGSGRLDRRNALHRIAKNPYLDHRAFFADESTAIAAGYRPCGNARRKEHSA